VSLHETLIEDHETGGGLPSNGAMNARGLRLTKAFEGYSKKPYRCPANVWTIGHGATRGLDGKRINGTHKHITPTEGESLLRRDLATAERAVRRLGGPYLNRNQFSACVSFVYNLGSGSFNGSTLRKMLLRGDLDEAAGQFQRWFFARGRKLPGLLRRRLAERDLFLS